MSPSAAAVDGSSARSGRWIRILLCGVMCVWVFAFTPNPIALATLPALVAGLALIERCPSFKQAVMYVAIFGAIAIGIGYSWLAATVQLFGGLAVPVSWCVLALFGALGTLHAILFAGLYRLTLRGPRRPHPMLTCVIFVACEVLPIRFLPWMAGNGAVNVAPLRQAAEWGGVAAVSFALVCLIVPFHEWIVWVFAKSGAPARPKAALATFAVGAAIFGVGFVRYNAVLQEDAGAAKSVKIGIAQGNIGSLDKRGEENHGGGGSPQAYRRTTEAAVKAGAELIVWPETVFGGSPDRSIGVWDPVSKRVRDGRAISQDLARLGYGFVEEFGRDRAILLGGWEDERRAERFVGVGADRDRYNAAMLREGGGMEWSLYRKVHLIPFGETMPLTGILPSLQGLLPQAVAVTAGTLPQPMLHWKAKDLKLATFICYEAILSDFVREIAGDERPDLLVNMTNDSWYGDTWEPHQHLNFSRFRAVEHRCPMVRATNTGISAFVDASGDVLSSLPYDTEGTLVRTVPIVDRGRTIYEQFGWLVKWILWSASAAGIAWIRFRPASPSA